jgi:predicted Zn-dependent protease
MQRCQWRLRHWLRPILSFLGLAVCTALLTALLQTPAPSQAQNAPCELPPLPQVHPLPPALVEWREGEQSGDYFAAVRPTVAGYLVWSRFPIKVYIEPLTDASGNDRSQWTEPLTQAVQEWSLYLPLEITSSLEAADITIWHNTPPLQSASSSSISDATAQTGIQPEQLPRVRSAETSYELFVDRPLNAPATLSHHCRIQLSPSQTPNYIKAAARHELGHALGIWGHSPLPSDALYFSQVGNPPPISPRDISTLKRVYEQPTQLGWAIRKE